MFATRHARPEGLSGPGGLPGLGALIPFARDPLGFLSAVRRDHGPVAFFRLVDHDIFFVSDPELVDLLLVRQAKNLHKDALYELLRPLLGDGLVTSEGDVWKRHRRLAAPEFSAKHVQGYADEMVACTVAYAEGLAAGSTVDVHTDMMALTQQIVLNTLFGKDLGVDLSHVGEAIEVVMDGFVSDAQGLGRVIPRGVPTPSRVRSRRAIERLDAVIYDVIAARRAAGPGDDLLSRLLSANDDEGQGFSDQALRDEAVTAFVAGHETTALALTYTTVLLGENPAVWDPLCAEVDSVLGTRHATAADLHDLPYTTAVIRESMRVLPPVWAIGREAQQDIDLDGVTIPTGSQILIAQWVMHRDPEWFPDPEHFRPERWLDGLMEQLPRMAYLPFGGGPRVCIGLHFAMLEAVLVLATLTQHVKLCTTGPRPRMLPSITLRPRDPVPTRVDRRVR